MPEIRFLFRFRDLVAETITEHEKIIKDRGSCWWGWWKRPSENRREDVWNALASSVSQATPQVVGLFDSGSGKVFQAVVTAVIQPDSEDTAIGRAVNVPADQEHLVPTYYRESPFSRAWMRLTEIREVSYFFSQYSYAEAPKLPQYTAFTLSRLKGKKIINADELRLMDTTVWEIRKSEASDPQEQILLSVAALPSAVTQEVVRCKSNEILHITDLHFALGPRRDQHVWRLESEASSNATSASHSMVEAIQFALTDRKIGLVIASGDFTYVGSVEEFNEAAAALSHLLGVLDLSTDHLIIIPGNHDIQWGTNDRYDYDAKVSRAPPEARANYEAFYRRIMRHDPNKHLAMGRRYVLPCGSVLEICALNSSSLTTGKNFLAGMGRIDEAAFADVSSELGWTDDQNLAFRLLVVHHHLALTEDLESSNAYGHGYGIAIDAVRVQRLAAKRGVHLAVHGHKHRAFIWRSSIFEAPEHTKTKHRLGELSLVGGGSVGSKETENNSNYFNVIRFSSISLKIEIFQSINKGSFEKIQTWQAGITIDTPQGRLQLGDWNKAE